MWKKTICPYDCPSSCGLLADVVDGRVVCVKGDPENAATGGLTCSKMRHYERAVNSPERLTEPLRRAGKKGEGRFEPITWDEAIQTIADRWKKIIREYGPETILPVYYSGVMSLVQRRGVEALSGRLGFSKLVMSLCSSAKGAAQTSVMGATGVLDPRELKDCGYLILWGSDVKATRIHTMAVIGKLRREGKKVILIEVCGEDMAPYCDEVILVRPGSDGALALALMQVLDEEGLTDEEFLNTYTYGQETFRATLGAYTPEWAEKITGVPAERIRRLAREYGRAKAPAILLGSGPSRQGNGGMNCRLIQILPAFVGAWRYPGGGYCGGNPSSEGYYDSNLVQHPEFRKKPPRMVNINLLGAALTQEDPEQKLRSVLVMGGNPVSSVSDQTALIRGFSREDLFTVVHERHLTDTARFADILLPATYSVEHADCYTPYGYCITGAARKLVDPPGECKSNWELVCLLAAAMGCEEDCFRKTAEDLVKELLEHPLAGLARIGREDRERLWAGDMIAMPFADHLKLRTPTGKIQIVDEQQEIPVPCYLENYGGPYPLRLICVPGANTLNTVFNEREDLRQLRGGPNLILNVRDAAARGIRDGDAILAFNELAEVEFTARLSELVLPGVAAAPGVFDSRSGGFKLRVNALHHGRVTDMGAATCINDNTINVRKLCGSAKES